MPARASVWRPLLFGLVAAAGVFALFRLAGQLFFIEGRTASNMHALGGAAAGLLLGWLAGRMAGGLRGGHLRGAVLAALPGLLLMAAVTSHFGLALPNIDPQLDKGFGGLMLWFHGFWLAGGLVSERTRRTT
jgi:hypothetical protein